MNLAKCFNCLKMDLGVNGLEKIVDEEDNENIEYDHVCIQCNHVVSKHQYEFFLEDGRQEYRMNCLLCGFAEDSISVAPFDPRKASASNNLI